MADKAVLTREYGLENSITPTGRTLEIYQDRTKGRFIIRFADGKGGTLPEELRGEFTAPKYAQTMLSRYLTQFWDLSDKSTKKVA